MKNQPKPKLKEEELHILITLYIFHRLGRKQLSKLLEIGEGKTRSILDSLKKLGYVETTRGGNKLSNLGKQTIERLLFNLKIKSIHLLPANEICKDCIASMYRIECHKLGNIVEIRDEAVRKGAIGALIIKVKNGKYLLPPDIGELSKYYPKIEETIKHIIKPKEGEVLIITYSKDYKSIIIGGLHASKKLASLCKT